MTGHDNVQLIEEVEKAQKENNWAKFSELHAPNVVLRSPDNPQPVTGRDNVVKWYRGFFEAFPDLTPKRGTTIAQGEWVCAEYVVTGTHKGPLPGPDGTPIPPTHKRVTIPNCSVYKVQNGKVVEVHEYFDLAGFMAQLGLGPSP